jgi:hypothetical protein
MSPANVNPLNAKPPQIEKIISDHNITAEAISAPLISQPKKKKVDKVCQTRLTLRCLKNVVSAMT